MGTKVKKKKNREEEPIWVIIHINIEGHKEIPYRPTLNKQKCHFFLSQNQRTRGQNRPFLEFVTSGREEGVGG
jgi:hypothetical protein